MRKIALASSAIAGALLVLSSPAAALPKTWVASNGGGSTCSRAAPCATFQAAHDATDAGGVINCLDAGDYGSVNINRSISIICDNTQAGIVTSASIAAIFISAGASDIVTLQGLDLDGGGNASFGIAFVGGATLHVHNVRIRNFRGTTSGTSGILFTPFSYAELYVVDSVVADSGNPSAARSGGIVIRPSSAGAVNAFLSRAKVENNFVGIRVDGTDSTGVAVNATVTDSVITGSASDGILAISSAGHAAASVFVDHCVIAGNFGSGVNANGVAASGAGSAFIRLGDSTIVLNATGVSTTGAGVVQSMKNNRISGNLTDGTPVPAYPGPGGTPLQ
jgi:hypothetical protein